MSFSSLRRRAALSAVGTALVITLPLGLTAISAPSAVAASAAAKSAVAASAPRALSPTQAAIANLPDSPRTPKAIAKRMVLVKHDWSVRQWRCVRDLWARESGWRVRAGNAAGGPYGIPQAFPGHKMGDGWKHSARVQIRWGLNYIKGRYGNPCAANSHQLTRHWY